MFDELDALRPECRFEAASDALVLLIGVSRAGKPGSATLVLLDEDRRLVDPLVVEDGGSQLRRLVQTACEADIPDVTDLRIVTDRTGEVPADRFDDELLWLDLVELAESLGINLLDWFVVSGRYGFSVAEHAAVPAQW